MPSKPKPPAKATPKPKPAEKANPKQTLAQRRAQEAEERLRVNRVAAGLIAGQTVTSIAQNEGVCRQTVSKIANGSTIQQIIGELVREQAEAMGTLFVDSLAVIQQALTAERYIVIEGALIPLGADHFARLTAAKRALEFLLAGRAAPKQPEDPDAEKPMTATELRKILAEHSKDGHKK